MKQRIAMGGIAAMVLLCDAGLSMAAGAAPGAAVRTTAAEPYRELSWNELVPKDWDPVKSFSRRNAGILQDGSLEAEDALRAMRSTWDNAPIVSALDGVAVKLPGYIVPLDEVRGELKEFLLVPYFGACIHSPPPPANQILHVVPGNGLRGFHAMDTVWVSGRLTTSRQASYMGASGYRIDAALVEHYLPKGR